MKTSSLYYLALIGVLIACSGCTITGYKASEVHQSVSYPLIFTDTIDATGIRKTTREDGTVVHKAESLTHSTNVGGFSRTVVYKDAELKQKPEKK